MPGTPGYFCGKTILITGGASGIGRATAEIFAREKANVVVADIDADGASETARNIRHHGAEAVAFRVDVTDRSSVEETISASIEAFGQIDFQLNSAGSPGRRSGFLEIDPDLWRQSYALNVDGVFHCMQGILPHMIERSRGVIVNIASMAHRRGGPGHSVHYASAKGAVVTMTMGVAREFVDRGIRALSISPGPIDTPFHAVSSRELVEQMQNDVPMKRFGRPEEIGEMVLFMCSDACEYMTADTVYVNGGGGWR